MKTIAIPIEEDKGLESKVASNFGDGKYYLIVKTEGTEVVSTEARKAPEKNCSKWSCRAEEFLPTLDCDVIIAPSMGKKARSVSRESGVETADVQGGKARDVLDEYLTHGSGATRINEYCPHSVKGMHTAAAHAGGGDPLTGSVMPPIYQTSTFSFKNAVHGANLFSGQEEGFIYTRMGNPTIRALEDTVTGLEGGFAGLATSSGMAALVSILMTFLGKDLHVVGTDSVYGPSRVVVEKDFSRFGVEYSFVDTSDIEEVKAAVRPNTRLLFIETPANPTIKLTDLAACAEIARDNDALLAVDNTFMSPILQRPFESGADIVFQSMTKFMNGHSDVVAGMIVTRSEELYQSIYKTLIYLGGTMDPHQAYLVIRGIKTLALRVEKAQENAVKIASYLESHPRVEWVRYPGLKSHPQYDLALKQMKGPGSLISFGIKGGLEAGRKVMDTVKVATLAVSLGGVETLIQHPASMTHAAMAPEDRQASGITDGLVRISVGCEDFDDLREDLEQALL